MSALTQTAIALAVAALAYFWLRAMKAKKEDGGKRRLWMPKALLLGSIWFASGRLLSMLFGTQGGELTVEVFPKKMMLFGIELSQSIVFTWVIMAVVLLLAILFRLLVVPRFKDVPKGLQNLIESSIEGIDRYTHGKLHVATEALACYMFTIAVLIFGTDFIELLGFRPPTADLVMTLSMALITFVLINYYGIKEKGVGGRIKSLASPNAAILPIRILVDLAIPISLACRLFGNILGGMIVMDLLKYALGAGGIGITPLAGLYFNVFHPAIQAFIFITLSLTFISEAVE